MGGRQRYRFASAERKVRIEILTRTSRESLYTYVVRIVKIVLNSFYALLRGISFRTGYCDLQNVDLIKFLKRLFVYYIWSA